MAEATLLDQILDLTPCRGPQIRLLYNLYADGEPMPDAVFIHGPTSTGKSYTVHQLLKSLDLRYAYVNLVACFTPRILFETMLTQLTTAEASAVKCDNLMDFIEQLKRSSELARFVIVLDRAEQLRDKMASNLLPGLLRLKEITKLDVSVILISQLPFQKYLGVSHVKEPIKIRFAQYNMKELVEILALDFEYVGNLCVGLDIDEEFYENYLNMFLSVFYQACRDLSELRYLARKNIAKYCEPIRNGQCKQSDARGLWRHISPILKDSLDTLYLRITSTKVTTILTPSLELPFYSKYLLIAAYLASYNPAKDDKRIFMRQHGKKRKTLRQVASKSKVSEQLNTQLGPKAFSLDRLLAIFYAILDDKVGFNNNLLVQVSSLVELQLLTAMSDSYNLDGQRYKCTVNMEFISSLANMVGFNIRKYLSDFSHM